MQIQYKSGVGIPEMYKKDEASVVYEIHLWSGAIGKKRTMLLKMVAFKLMIGDDEFLNTFAVHMECIRL
jgi:hypothetical protein